METKWFLKSWTMRGLILAIAAVVLKWAQARGKLTWLTPDGIAQYVDAGLQFIEAIGLGTAFLGRFNADKPVTVLPKPAEVPDSEDDGGSNAGLPGLILAIFLTGGMFAGGAGVACLGGCSAFVSPTPATQQDQVIRDVNAANAAYFVTATGINVAFARGDISPKTMAILVPLQQVAYGYLQAATDAAKQWRTVDAVEQQRLFYDALAKLSAAFAPGIPTAPPVIVTPSTRPATN